MTKFAGKALHKSVAVAGSFLRSLIWINWYRLCWDVGARCRIGGRIRRRAYGGHASFGSDCILGHHLVVDVARDANLIVGNRVAINGGTYISVLDRIEIGDDTLIGEYCSIRDNDHQYRDPALPVRSQGMLRAPIVIGRDVWMGRNVMVQKGVRIGNGVVIGANSFINRDIPDFAVVAGSPARILRQRGD